MVGLHVPSRDTLKADFVTLHKVADIHLAQSLLLFLQSCAKGFQIASPGWDAVSIWAFMKTLLGTAIMALHPQVMDGLNTACWQQAKFCKDVLWEIPSSSEHELTPMSFIVPLPVGLHWAQEALKVAPQVVKLLPQPAPEPQQLNKLWFRLCPWRLNSSHMRQGLFTRGLLWTEVPPSYISVHQGLGEQVLCLSRTGRGFTQGFLILENLLWLTWVFGKNHYQWRSPVWKAVTLGTNRFDHGRVGWPVSSNMDYTGCWITSLCFASLRNQPERVLGSVSYWRTWSQRVVQHPLGHVFLKSIHCSEMQGWSPG